MKRLTITYFFLIFIQTGYSQIKISGKIHDEFQNPIEFATCVLLKDSIVMDNSISDSLGFFYLNSNQLVNCELIIHYLNIEKKINLNCTKDTLLDFQLNMNKDLEEVSISVKKPLIVKSIDRITYNVENSISSQGGSALDVMKKAPGVRVNNSTISITGKSTVSIYIDDRQIKLAGEELVMYLKSIPSDDISKIEVITTPPSKYDAQGNCGIINIVLKQVRKKGFSGNVFGSVGRNSYLFENGGGNFTYNKNKLSFNCALNSDNLNYKKTQRDIIQYPTNLWDTKDEYKICYKNTQGDLSLNYKINSKTNTGVNYHNQTMNLTDNGVAEMRVLSQSNLDSMMRTNLSTSVKYTFQNAYFFIDHELDTNGKKITFNLDWLNVGKKDNRDLQTNHFNSSELLLANSSSQVFTNGTLNTNSYSTSLNADLPFKKFQLTAGLKSSYVASHNKYNYSDLIDNQIVLNLNQSNAFKYVENIEAAFVDFSKEIGNWSFKTGLRAEYTNVSGRSITMNLTNNYHYLKLFPTVYIQRILKNDNTIGFTYSRRINRPAFYYLNPFRFYNNPYAYEVGNPFLRPEFNNNFELSYTYQEALTMSLSYIKLSNGIGDVANLDSTTYMFVTSSQNCLKSNAISWNLNYVFNKFSWWENYNELSIYFVSTKTNLRYTAPQIKGGGAYFETDNQFIFNKKKTISGEVNFWYSFRSVEGVAVVNPYFGLDFGVRKLFMGNKLKIALNVVDIFKTDSPNFSRTSNGMKISTKAYYDARQIRLSISYKFGNDKITKIDREGSNDELLNRAK